MSVLFYTYIYLSTHLTNVFVIFYMWKIFCVFFFLSNSTPSPQQAYLILVYDDKYDIPMYIVYIVNKTQQ